MLLGLNLGEAPLGRDLLARVEALTVDVDRFNVPLDAALLEHCVRSWVGTRIRPQFLFHRVGMTPLVAPLVALALELYGPEGFDLEGPNEWRMQDGATLEQAIADTLEIHRIARTMGWQGAMLSASIMNLDPERDIPDLRALATRLPTSIILSVHRYSPGTWYGGQTYAAAWRPATSRSDELSRLHDEAQGHRIAITEHGPHRAPERVLLGLRTVQKTFDDCYRWLVDELRLFASHGIERACPYQWNDGPNPNESEHMRGLCGVDVDGRPGELHPHAQALIDWRT